MGPLSQCNLVELSFLRFILDIPCSVVGIQRMELPRGLGRRVLVLYLELCSENALIGQINRILRKPCDRPCLIGHEARFEVCFKSRCWWEGRDQAPSLSSSERISELGGNPALTGSEQAKTGCASHAAGHVLSSRSPIDSGHGTCFNVKAWQVPFLAIIWGENTPFRVQLRQLRARMPSSSSCRQLNRDSGLQQKVKRS